MTQTTNPLHPRASSRPPTVDTIMKWCDSDLAVQILAERGILTDMERDGLYARIKEIRDAMYGSIYGDTD